MEIEYDWRKALCMFVVKFDVEQYERDYQEGEGEARNITLPDIPGMDSLTRTVMNQENAAVQNIVEHCGVTMGQSSYEENDLWVTVYVGEKHQVDALCKFFLIYNTEGNINPVAYIDASGLVFCPTGYSGIRIASESSIHYNREYDLHEWYDERKEHRAKNKIKSRVKAKRRQVKFV